MAQTYDAIIIGTGQAGPFLAHRLAGAGMKVATVERKLFGGTCVNTGCIPTKTMVASAYAAHIVRRAADFGVVSDGAASVDMKLVKARKDAISGLSRTGVESGLRGMANCTVYQGHARFESPHEVSVGSERLAAERVFVNVGGRAVLPQIPGIAKVPFLTNSSMMGVDFLPHHLIIVGGGYIALEFAQMYRRFGSEVTVIGRAPRLARREDEDVSTAIREILEQEGVNIRLNANCIGLSKRGDEILAQLDCASGDGEVRGSTLLLAVGRRPNTDDLGLEKAGVAVDKHGYIVVDDHLQTSVPGIWAVGDCNGRGAFTHTAFNDAEIVGANLLDNDPRKVSDRIPAYALYIDPPLGRVGMTETEVRKSGRRALIGRRLMTRVGRAVEKGEPRGFMKIMVDAEDREILGAAILGTGGDEAIHSILDTMYAKAPYTAIQRAMHIHPTVSELIPTMLGELSHFRRSRLSEMKHAGERLRRLSRAELPVDTVDLARYLIGKVVVHDTDEGRLSGRVVETEAYPAGDSAGHAFRGETPGNRTLYLARGYAYVHFTYGMWFMLNVSSEVAGVGAGLLLRALEPLEGIDQMQRFRDGARLLDLARGPGRLGRAMQIDLGLDGVDLCAAGPLWLAANGRKTGAIGRSVRIGLTRNVDLKLRFYERGNPYVSGPGRLRE